MVLELERGNGSLVISAASVPKFPSSPSDSVCPSVMKLKSIL